MRLTTMAAAFLTILATALPLRAEFPKPNYSDYVGAQYAAEEFLAWTSRQIDGKPSRVSPPLTVPEGYEINHHHVIVDFTGAGTVEVGLAHSADGNLDIALSKSYLFRSPRKVAAGKPEVIPSGYKGERYAWLVVRTEGDVTVTGVRYACWRGRDTIFGHVAGRFEFAGATLPYRLMYPRNFDPQKRYPLVLSVSGSGGVGGDNAKQMENVILARYLFMQYYLHEDLECFSLVPQIPSPEGIPAPYFPKGPQGAPDAYHPGPGLAAVNENGWYVQATLALIRGLIEDKSIPVDPDRVYYSGFSFGGKACWEFLKADREMFAAAIAGAGWPVGMPYTEPAGPLLDRLKLEVQRYKHVPVLVFAGENDKMKLGTQAVHRAILAAGGKSQYLEVSGADHTGSSRAWGDRKNIAWLFEQNRKNNPPPGPDPYPGGVYPQP